MSADVREQRHRRRRLLIFRPSPNDVQTAPLLQQGKTPDLSGQTPASGYHRDTLQHKAWLQTPPTGQVTVDQRGPLIRTPAPQTPPSREISQHAPSAQTPPPRRHRAEPGPPLLLTPSRDDGPPMQTPCSRHRRGSRLQTTPSKYCAPRNTRPACLLASPLEKTANRVMYVQLRDVAHEVVPPHPQTPPMERNVAGACAELGSSSQLQDPPGVSPDLPPGVSPDLPPAVSPDLPPAVSPDLPPAVSPQLPPLPSSPPPAKVTTWGLVPLFQSVRTKLENFADIFFSPIKSRRVTADPDVPPPSLPANEESLCVDGSAPPSVDGTAPLSVDSTAPLSVDSTAPLSVDSTAPPSVDGSAPPSVDGSAPPSADGTAPLSAGDPCTEERTSCSPGSSSADMKLRLKIEISSAAPSLCRPPLQRCLSCPVPPHRRHSLDTVMECSCTSETPRKRRHSVGTVEECRKLPLSPLSLTCLRKERHPSVLWTPQHKHSVLHCTASSPIGRCLDVDIVRESERSTGGADTSEGSHPLSQENKVSSIQIRKRVARPEGSLTPMGLPKRLRLQKEEFSLEEIYTNKNYRTPTEKRKFETIFEEPVMKGGSLLLTSQRPLRRTMVFKDSSAPRRRKKKGRGGGRTRSSNAIRTATQNFDLLLQNKLEQLEAELQH